MKSKVIEVFVGIPGSGKSTMAESEVKNSQGSTVRVNKDDLREMIYPGQKHSRQREKMILGARDSLVFLYLEQSHIDRIIIDDTNLHPKHFHRMKEIAVDHESKTGVHVDVSCRYFSDSENVELCHRRNEQRERTVPYTVIENMYRQYMKSKIERDKLPWPLTNRNGEKAIICDIDGTLAHRGKRSPFDWSRVGEDALDKRVYDILVQHSLTHDIILMSGRDSVCREETLNWLDENSVPYYKLFMRPANNSDPDYKIKYDLYVNHVLPHWDVDLVLDDRMQVVRLWRALGLKCFQVADGFF